MCGETICAYIGSKLETDMKVDKEGRKKGAKNVKEDPFAHIILNVQTVISGYQRAEPPAAG